MAAFGQLCFRLPCKLLEAVICEEMGQGATYITEEHYRCSSLGCTFQDNSLIFTKPCVLLSLQHARKAKKSTALEMIMPGAPFARVT